MVKKIISLIGLILTACSGEQAVVGEDTVSSPVVVMDGASLGADANGAQKAGALRAYWSDEAVGGNGSTTFHWEANTTDVHTAIYRLTNPGFVQWGDDNYVSVCGVTPWQDDATATIKSAQGVKVLTGIAPGDKVFYANKGAVTGGKTNATVVWNLPATFSQTASGGLSETGFSQYAYIYAESVVKTVLPTNIIVSPAVFHPAMACIRLVVTNLGETAFTLKDAILEAKNADGTAAKLFPGQLTWTSVAGATPTVTAADDTDGYYSSITTTINGSTGLEHGIGASETATKTYYMMVFPMNDGSDFGGKTLDFHFTTTVDKYTAYHFELPAANIPNQKFEAGKIYTLRFEFGRTPVLYDIHVQQWGNGGSWTPETNKDF